MLNCGATNLVNQKMKVVNFKLHQSEVNNYKFPCVLIRQNTSRATNCAVVIRR